MGQRGPKKTPAAVKKSRGTFRADRDTGKEVAAGMPTRPEWLGDSAIELWDDLAPQLVRENLLTPVDGLAFALLCQTYSIFRDAHEWIGDDIEKMVAQSTRTDKDGNELSSSVYQHPIVGVFHKSRNDLLRLCREFGLTPSSRAGMRLGSNDDSDDDPIAALSKQVEELMKP